MTGDSFKEKDDVCSSTYERPGQAHARGQPLLTNLETLTARWVRCRLICEVVSADSDKRGFSEFSSVPSPSTERVQEQDASLLFWIGP